MAKQLNNSSTAQDFAQIIAAMPPEQPRPAEPVATQSPVKPSVATTPAAPAAPSLQEQLTAMLLRRMSQEDAERQSVIEKAEAMRQSMIPAMLRAEEERLMTQSLCQHKKENNTTALGGQRDHSHVVHYLCQNCGKEWNGANTADMQYLREKGLMPSPIIIGGPF